MNGDLLVLNAGSSSVKFSIFSTRDGVPVLACHGQVAGLGGADGRFHARDRSGTVLADEPLAAVPDHEHALSRLLAWLERRESGRAVAGAGHRVVHGGLDYTAPVLVDAQVLARLARFGPLAPQHQPHNLSAIRALAKIAPGLPQVACFDTGFHATQEPLARRFGLPRALHDAGVRRYGFHGLSYEYVAGALPAVAGSAAEGRVVVAHLGNGASMCAMRARRSVDSSMGFTALDGLPMGSRCGALDPGVVLYLIRERGMTPEQVERLLYEASGLLGVSGVSNDMRTLLASTLPAAREAVDFFCFRIARELGALAASLGGLDALVFTGGIGEHAAQVRAAVCRRAAWLGLVLDDAANDAGGPRITRAGSRVAAYVVATDEELMIARHTARVLRTRDDTGRLMQG